MSHPYTLPLIAGLFILGGGMGAWLGNSAISAINPAYYSEADSRFHADLAPNRSPEWAQVGVAEQAALADGAVTSCIGCMAWPEEYRPVADRAVFTEDREIIRAVSAADPVSYPRPATAEPDPEWQRVQVYSTYPVHAEEEGTAEAADFEEESAGD